MDTVTQAAGVCLIAAVLGLALRRRTPELALLLSLAAAAAVLLSLAAPLGALLDFLRQLSSYTGVSETLFAPLYKTLAIALVVRLGGGLCADAGDSALRSVLETAGTVCALTAALPLLQQVLDVLMELI